MTKLYKLTTADFKTRKGEKNECLWGVNVTHRATGEGKLCSSGWIHAYEHPLLAVLLNPIHANIKKAVLWECRGKIILRDGQLKVGCQRLTTLRQIPLPKVRIAQRIRFALYCALAIYRDEAFIHWANSWLDGSDRSTEAAWTVIRGTESKLAWEKVFEEGAGEPGSANLALQTFCWAAGTVWVHPHIVAVWAARAAWTALAAEAQAVKEAAYWGEHFAPTYPAVDLITIAERAIKEEKRK